MRKESQYRLMLKIITNWPSSHIKTEKLDRFTRLDTMSSCKYTHCTYKYVSSDIITKISINIFDISIKPSRSFEHY